MYAFTPASPADAPLLGRLRQRCWAAAYRGVYPDDMIDRFDYAWHEARDLARISSRPSMWPSSAQTASPSGT